jgi:hypothetical protein
MEAIARPGSEASGALLYPPAQCPVECVTHPGGAVIAVVVVMIEAVFRLLVPLQKFLQLPSGVRRYLQLLDPY